MARMAVVYRTPKDREACDRLSFEAHVPTAKKLPRLTKYEVSRQPVVSPFRWKDAYLVATWQFTSLEAIKAAFASDGGRACAADRRILAPDDSDVQIFCATAVKSRQRRRNPAGGARAQGNTASAVEHLNLRKSP